MKQEWSQAQKETFNLGELTDKEKQEQKEQSKANIEKSKAELRKKRNANRKQLRDLLAEKQEDKFLKANDPNSLEYWDSL